MRPVFVTIRLRSCVLWVMIVAALVFLHRGTVYAPMPLERMGPLSHLRVVVDPGHGGIDGGCSQQELYEKTINLLVGLALRDELHRLGAQTVLTRTEDKALAESAEKGLSRHRCDLQERILIAKQSDADIFLSLHVNAASPRLGGSLTFYRRGDDESRRLAGLVQEQLELVVPGNQNGILPGRFLVISCLNIPAVLIEMGFLTNPQDLARLTAPDSQVRLAEAIARGVVAFAAGDVAAKAAMSPFVVPKGFEDETNGGEQEVCHL